MRREQGALILLAAGIVLVASSLPGRAQECGPAGAAVEVHARVAGRNERGWSLSRLR